MAKKKARKKSKKKTSRKVLKEKAWKAFSLYIRLKYSDDNGFCECVTCGSVKHYSELQAGHAVPGRGNAVLFNEDVVFPQDAACNIFLNGNYNQYALFMIDMYGRAKFEELLELKNKVVKISTFELQEIYEKYTKLTRDLGADKGLQ